jgi:hypothetical protein
MEAKTRLLEKVNFTANKVEVSAAVANRRLLKPIKHIKKVVEVECFNFDC